MTVDILLVEDHTLVRAGMRALLGTIPCVDTVAESSNGREALEVLQTLSVDIVLLDIAMPEMNGLQALTQIRQRHPQIRVLMLSMFANEEYALHTMRNGAAGYLLKDAGKVELQLAIEAVAQGQTYLSPVVAHHLSTYMQRPDQARTASPPEREVLTTRQHEILRLIAQGRSAQQIAHELGISSKTVDTHRAQLMQRLDIHEIAGLVRYAVRMGVIEC